MPLRYWVFVFLTLGLTAAVSVATYRSSQLLRRWQPDRNLLLLFSENVIRLLLIALCIGLGWLSGLPPAQLGWAFAGWQSDLIRGLVWGAVMAGGFYMATTWIVARSGERFYSPIVVDAVLPRSARELLWTSLAMIGVVAAEELLFRSLLIGGLQPILPAALLLTLTSVLFGVLHLPQGAWGVFGAALAGALLGSALPAHGQHSGPARRPLRDKHGADRAGHARSARTHFRPPVARRLTALPSARPADRRHRPARCAES